MDSYRSHEPGKIATQRLQNAVGALDHVRHIIARWSQLRLQDIARHLGMTRVGHVSRWGEEWNRELVCLQAYLLECFDVVQLLRGSDRLKQRLNAAVVHRALQTRERLECQVSENL